MPFFFGRAYRRMGKHYFLLYVVFEFVSAFVVCLATLGLFALYTDPSGSDFWTIAIFAEACVMVSTAIRIVTGRRSANLTSPIAYLPAASRNAVRSPFAIAIPSCARHTFSRANPSSTSACASRRCVSATSVTPVSPAW